MYKFEWSELVTDEFLAKLQDIVGANIGADVNEIKYLLALILKNTGGLPIADTDLTATHRTMLAEKFLADSVGHYLAASKLKLESEGSFNIDSDHFLLDSEIKSHPVVDCNNADVDELEALPTIGQQRAKAIIHERTNKGYFESLEEMVVRVNGIGEKATETLQHITTFELPVGSQPSSINNDLITRRISSGLDEFNESDQAKNLVKLLDAIASVSAKSPHPATVELIPRIIGQFIPEPLVDSEFVACLEGRSYYKHLPDLLRSATNSIKVAMFHVAFTSDNHPTKVLLDELIAAKNRGVDVKVILDRDRLEDPYMSTVINSASKAYLEANGVACRFDAGDVLLHSKYVVIDNKQTIIGSHNWSAGSYFHFDDMSFVVDSADFSSQSVKRFNLLWSSGSQ